MLKEIVLFNQSRQLVDNIFEMEWQTMNENTKQSLMIIMKRAVVPIQITSAYIIPMNLEAFMGVSIENLIYKMS